VNVLILDDDPGGYRLPEFRRRLKGNMIYHVKTAREAIALLRSNQMHVAFLDHDLGGTPDPEPSGPGTGYEVAVWLREHPEHMPNQVVVHSMNGVGQANMKRALPGVLSVPGAWEKL